MTQNNTIPLPIWGCHICQALNVIGTDTTTYSIWYRIMDNVLLVQLAPSCPLAIESAKYTPILVHVPNLEQTRHT
jgi:hypothetical protein